MSMRESVPNTEDFTIKVTGDTTGTEWFGKFTAKKRLSFNDQFKRDQFRRKLLGPEQGTPSAEVNAAATIFSELWVRLTTAPSWWTDADEGRELSDGNVAIEVFQQAMKIEERALEEVQKKAKKAEEDLKDALKADEDSIKA